MSNPNEKAAPSPKNAASNSNDQNPTSCRCSNQAVTRRDLFAGLMMAQLVNDTSESGLRSAAWRSRKAAEMLVDVLNHVRDECL